MKRKMDITDIMIDIVKIGAVIIIGIVILSLAYQIIQ